MFNKDYWRLSTGKVMEETWTKILPNKQEIHRLKHFENKQLILERVNIERLYLLLSEANKLVDKLCSV